MRLSELIAGLNCRVYNFRDVSIESLEFDSRNVKPGTLFIALAGNKYDGHDFVKSAEKMGASAVAVQRKVDCMLPQVVFNDTREILGKLARNFYGMFPDLKIIGITGTNGKTTTSFLLHSILQKAGLNPGLIGTIYYWGKNKIKASRTTPESLDIFKLVNSFYTEGIRSIVMEVSSHALALKRVEELAFEVAIFMNLSQDHLDFHGTLNEYKLAKMHLFDLLAEGGFAIVNIDDPVGVEIKESGTVGNVLTFGLTPDADIRGEIEDNSNLDLRMKIIFQNYEFSVGSHLKGKFNCYNILAAAATGIALGIDQETIRAGIENLKGVRGRMEHICNNIYVDFAHTPEALSTVLSTLRKYARGKLVVIFGCGGDRDRDKRAKMGRIASEIADFVIVTSDNPRSEDPEKIIHEIVSGIKNNNYTTEIDREKAIQLGISMKKDEDILLIAGKGHEEYQIIGDKIIPFDDRMIVRKLTGQ